MKKLLAILLALVMVLSFSTAMIASADELPEIKVVIPTAGGAQNIETLYTEKWMDLVTERTEGKVTFDYTNGGALGSYAELVEGVNYGAYDMTVTDISQLESYVPEVAIVGLPFLMKNYDHLKAVYGGEIWDWLQEKVESESNMMIMTPYFCGFREILTVDQLKTLADCQNYLIRVPQVDAYIKSFNSIGFAYTTLAWSECYTSMQTGVIDGIETAVMSLYNSGFYDLGKYVLLSHHMQAVNTVLVNKDFWNKLTDQYKSIMLEAFDELKTQEWDECIGNEQYYREQMEAKGCEFSEFSPEDVQEVNKRVQGYWDEVTSKIDGGAEIVEKILAAAA